MVYLSDYIYLFSWGVKRKKERESKEVVVGTSTSVRSDWTPPSENGQLDGVGTWDNTALHVFAKGQVMVCDFPLLHMRV